MIRIRKTSAGIIILEAEEQMEGDALSGRLRLTCLEHMNEQTGGAPDPPFVPDQQPADIEAQIDAPAYEEAIWQHWRAAVKVAVSGP